MWSLRRDDGHPWLAPPARAIRYSIVERLADWLTGRRDGLLGIPSVPAEVLDVGVGPGHAEAETAAEFSTHRLEQIRHHHHGRMEGERSAFLAFCDDLYGRQTEAEEQMRGAEVKVAALRHERATAGEPPSASALAVRRIAESDLSDELVRRRRLGEHQRRLRQVEERLTAAEEAAATARAAFDKIDRTVRGRWRLTLVRVHRLHEHAHRRANVYWRQLVRSHPQGDLLNGALARVGPDLPDWARDDAPSPVPVRETLPGDNDTDATSSGRDEKGGHGDPQVTAPQTAPDSRA
ncbi:hypothetical protein [Actinophytocola sp.]|uniref:hypothetical protein n=1 Tax=Actinophytocola sp. TaxID=1872138 RepID=UPI002ED32069